MKKILGAILMLAGLSNIAACAQDIYSITDFKGMVDIMPADKLEDTYSPDCQNVRLGDRYESSIEKRQGSQSILTTALPEGQPIRNTYNYTKVDGTKYLVFVSSLSLYYTSLNGSSTKIKTFTNIASTATFNFATAKNSLYGFSTSTTPFKWDGTTLTFIDPSISTNMVTAAYGVYHNNRMWRAGVSGNESTLYYSEVNDPENIGTFNYLYIDVSNGQNITGLLSSNGKLYAFKTFSAYEVVEVSAGSFVLRQISKDVGALYQKGITEYRGFPTFLSHRGVEVYDGQLNLITRPIDNYLNSLNVITQSNGSINIDSQAEWGDGTLVRVDTTTLPGYLVLTDTNSVSAPTKLVNNIMSDGSSGTWYRTKYIPDENILISTFAVNVGWYNAVSPYGSKWYFDVSFKAPRYESYMENPTTVDGDQAKAIGAYFPLLKGTTYWFRAYSKFSSAGSGYVQSKLYLTTDSLYKNQTTNFIEYSTDSGSTWNNAGYDGYTFCINLNYRAYDGYWQSSVKQASNISQWGTIGILDSQPGIIDIDYYIKVATASDVIGGKPLIPVTNGMLITTTTLPYVQFSATYTRGEAYSNAPYTDYISLDWISSVPVEPKLQSYKYNLYVAISTDTNTNINNVVLIFDQKNNWIPYNRMYIGDMCVINNNLYTGASNSAGTIYQQDITGLYTDAQVSGAGIDSYWCTKVIDCNLPFTEKTFDTIWITAANSGNWNISCDYRLDGTDGTWTEIPVSVYNSAGGLVKAKINLPQATKGYSIQLRIRDADANEYYQIRRIDLFYKPEPPR